jgi:hypothetical protein
LNAKTNIPDRLARGVSTVVATVMSAIMRLLAAREFQQKGSEQ